MKGILHCSVHRPGIASALEPALSRLPGLAEGAGTSADGLTTHIQARGNFLLIPLQGISITDMSVIQPLSPNALPRAASTAGAAAAPEQQKRTSYATV
jgi:hypothetical protein